MKRQLTGKVIAVNDRFYLVNGVQRQRISTHRATTLLAVEILASHGCLRHWVRKVGEAKA